MYTETNFKHRLGLAKHSSGVPFGDVVKTQGQKESVADIRSKNYFRGHLYGNIEILKPLLDKS